MSDLSSNIKELSPEQRELLELLLREEGLDASVLPISAQARDGRAFPLSSAQQRMWFLHQLEPASVAYNVSFAARLTGRLDAAALRESLSDIGRRHEALRTTFAAADGESVQVIGEPGPVSLPLTDLTDRPEAEREAEAARIVAAEARRPFDLVAGPVWRTTLLRLGEEEHVVVLTMHHIVSDAWSMGVFVRELAELYEAHASGRAPRLPELTVQYADFAVWQRQRLQGRVLDEHLAYWREQLAGSPAALSLPTDRPHPAASTYRGANYRLDLSGELSNRLAQLCRREDVTMFMCLLAAYKVLLYRYSGQEDVVVGTPIANRNRGEVEDLIGFFANTLVLRARLGGGLSFRELLARVRDVTLGAYAHQDLPFEYLVDELQPERELNRNPLFQVWFVLQNAPTETLRLPGLTLSEAPVESGTAKFDLALMVTEGPEGLAGELNYSTDLFDEATVARMARHFRRILEEVVADPGQDVARLPLLTAEEAGQILGEWGRADEAPRDGRRLHELFEEQAAKTPAAVALLAGDGQVTYDELNRRADLLAGHLRGLGVGPDSTVGVCMERSIEMVVGLLGVLKAGGAYVPLDPTYPPARLAFMLADAKAAVALTQSKLRGLLPESGVEAVCLDAGWGEGAEPVAAAGEPPAGAGDDNLAYVIYTSGSTGEPKGVMVPHGGAVNYLQWMRRSFPLEASDLVLQMVSLSFDVSVREIFWPLISGSRVYLLPPGAQQDLDAVVDVARRRGVTHIRFVPSILRVFLESHGAEKLDKLRRVFCGGEPLAADLVERFHASQTAELVNTYGPTETSVNATAWVCERGGGRVLIGRPVTNTEVYILDGRLEPVPVGVTGELYVGGDGLARGYLGRPDTTARLFIPSPFAGRPGARLYRTGDLARFRPGGQIEFVGRADHQVKVRGYRVELGEVEAVLATHPGVREAVVVADEEATGERRLVAYVVARDGAAPSADELREFVGRLLPEYMAPAIFVFLEAMPLTAGGKVDRRALPPAQAQAAPERSVALPRDNLEIQLAEIWREVLGLSGPVGVKDNFFALGGHSISAVRLMAQILKWFGQRLPLSALFAGATIEQLAEVLRGKAEAAAPSPLVSIQPKGTRRPFFCVHTGSGEVLCYEAWARHLGTQQPFYALQDHLSYRSDGSGWTLEEMAAHYLGAVRAVQKEGPYQLGGWSFGGLVAYEMAQQLFGAGEEVSLLVLVDAVTPAFRGKVVDDDDATLLTILANQLTRSTMTAEETTALVTALRGVSGREAQLRHVLRHFIKERDGGGVDEQYALEFLRRQLVVFRSRVRVSQAYEPRPYPGRVTLFRPLEEPAGMEGLDQTKGWGELARSVDVHRVPGNHQTMGFEPHARELAAELGACIERAAAAASG